MRWYYWPLFALIMGMMLGGSIAATIIAPIEKSSSIQTGDDSASAQHGENENRCEGKPFWEKTTCDPVAYFTLWLTGFTGILALSTIFLWIATQRILIHTRRTTEKQLRAYVNVAQANTAFIEGWRPIFQVVMKNGGQTPAYDIIGRIEALVKRLPLTEPLEFSANVESRRMGVVGPNGDYQFRLTGKPEIDEQLRTAIKNGAWAIFVIGDVHYRDVFGRDWFTEFALVFDDQVLADSQHQLPAWIDGNEAT